MKQELVALVTGAASGIGKAISMKLASRGISLLIADFNKERGHITAINASASLTGRLDYAANCAGICETIASEERSITTEWFDKVYSVNARGLWLCQKYEAQQMERQEPREVIFSPPSEYPIPAQRGSIVNVVSISGLTSLGLGAYTPSKHAAAGITKNGAKFYGPSGVRVNGCCPGWTVTEMTERHLGNVAVPGTRENAESPLNQKIALHRMGLAEEQANLVSFLLSDESSYMNGALVVNDGGFYDIDN
ncbi:unnamed protein product [Penicillium crustosum]